ncbi:MAG: MarR family winged helix-turn-helix transcriptional regulator [Anaerolineae bacterium]
MDQELQSKALDVIQKFLIIYRYVRRYGRKTQCEGVRGRELSTLRYLLEAGHLTIGQISDYLFLSPSSASELVSRMEDAGYVTRQRSTEDCRVVNVQLTPEGRVLAEEIPLGGIPLLRERIKAMTPDRLRLVDEAFTDLIQIMEIDPNEYQ